MTETTSPRPVKSVADAALDRVSIRRYTGNPIPREVLDEIVTLAGKAPSPWNVQPWRVIAVSDPDTKQKLMAAAYGQPQVGAAATVLVVTSDMKDAIDNAHEFVHPGMPEDKRQAQIEDIQKNFNGMGEEKAAQWGFAESNIFLGYLLLVIEAMGYGSSPMLGFDPAQVKELLGIPAHATIPALVAIGEKAEDGFPQFRHPVERILRHV